MNKALWEFSNTYRRYITLCRFLRISLIIIKFLLRSLLGKIISGRLSTGERIRLLIEKLGPTYIKFGQVLSTRGECPPLLRNELKKLQDRAPPFSYKEVEDTVEQELAAPIEELFISFNKEPVASASLAQVHEAVLRQGQNEQTRVAVKVQRPNLENIIEVDLSLLNFLARLIPKLLPRIRVFNLPLIIDAFGTALRREIDFILEGRNADKLAKTHENDDTVHIPKIYWDYTTKRVLTMEFIEGIKISEVEELDKAGLDRHRIALHMTRAYAKQIFRKGFLHADPHPANLFILDDEVIAFLDFGMVEYLDDKLLTDLIELLVALVHDNTGPRLAEEIMNIHTGNKSDVDYPKLVLVMSTFIDRHFVEGKMPLAQKGVGYIMNELVYEAIKQGIKLPQPLVLVIKTLLYMETLANELDPGFDVLDMIKPHVDRRLREKFIDKIDVLDLRRPKELVSDLFDAAGDTADLAKGLPRRVTAIMDRLEKGEVELKWKNPNNHRNYLVWSVTAIAVIVTLLVILILRI